MNWLDIVIIVVIVWFIFTGLTTGLIREVIQLAGLVVGVLLAGHYYSQVGQWLSFIDSPDAIRIASFLLIFVAVALAAHFLGSILQQMVSLLFLGWLDHLGGGVFGFAKGALICQLVLVAFAKFSVLGMEPAITESRLAPLFLKTFPFLLNLLPQEFEAVKQFFG